MKYYFHMLNCMGNFCWGKREHTSVPQRIITRFSVKNSPIIPSITIYTYTKNLAIKHSGTYTPLALTTILRRK